MQQTYEHIEEEDMAHDIIDTVVDYGGGWYLIVFAIVGVLVFFKKRIKKWLLS